MNGAASGQSIPQPTPAEIEAFWSRVNCGGSPDVCWLWPAHGTKNKYGKTTFRGSPQKVHRLAYRIMHGPIEAGQVIAHSCDNPPCVNPNHLLMKTQRWNINDCMNKGRANHASGERNAGAKLTKEQVAEIRNSYSRKKGARIILAKRFGVSVCAISRVVGGHTWKALGK